MESGAKTYLLRHVCVSSWSVMTFMSHGIWGERKIADRSSSLVLFFGGVGLCLQSRRVFGRDANKSLR